MRSIVLLASLGLLLMAWANRALAHAEFLGSEPADGAVLAAPPPSVRLRFSEPVVPLEVRLLDPAGAAVALPGPPQPADRSLTVPLPPVLGQGSHVLSWRVRSADGHPVSGSLVLSVGHVSRTAVAPSEAGTWPETLEPFAQALFYAGTLGAVGLVLFALLVRPPLSRPALATAAAVALVGGAVAVLCRGCALSGKGPLDPEALLSGWASPLGFRIGSALLGLMLLVATRGRQPWAILGLATALGAFPLAGHTAAAVPRWPWALALVLHVGFASFWLGALWPLFRLLRERPAAEAVVTVERFSRLATIAVPLLLAAGILLASHELDGPPALWTTRYGLLLSTKLAAVAALLALGTLNRQRLLPALAAGGTNAAHALRRSIGAEIVCAGLVLLATAELSATSPHPAASRVGDAAMQAARALTLNEGGFRAVLRLEPGLVGPNRLDVTLTDAEGHPATALEAELALERPEAGMAPLTRPLQAAGIGRFTAPDLLIPMSGRWRLTLSLLVSDFERTSLSGELEIR
ncbi:FixH family protein [Benzoatithermus flavus]|uniref:FixH family protein n=1 Tax=Benzoatithermus flavus TaxID=3108223 RepID=A0ABU8XNJ9_9PROT